MDYFTQNKKRTLIIVYSFLLLTILVFPNNLYSQTEYRVQSMFIYNFTTMVNWPSDYQSGDFVMAVYGSSPMLEEFENLAQRRSVGGRSIVTNQFNSVNQISKCHIIYIPSRHSRSVSDIVDHLRNNNIHALVVTDARGSIRNGTVINFTIKHDRQRFEISQRNAERLGLSLGGEIVRLGINMD